MKAKQERRKKSLVSLFICDCVILGSQQLKGERKCKNRMWWSGIRRREK